jgi:hypothetical protein
MLSFMAPSMHIANRNGHSGIDKSLSGEAHRYRSTTIVGNPRQPATAQPSTRQVYCLSWVVQNQGLAVVWAKLARIGLFRRDEMRRKYFQKLTSARDTRGHISGQVKLQVHSRDLNYLR